MHKHSLIPINLETCLSSADWLNQPSWPISQSDLMKHCSKPRHEMFLLTKTVEPELKPIINLASPLIAHWGAAFFEAALISEQKNFVGQSLIQKSVRDRDTKNRLFLASLPAKGQKITAMENQARRILRTSSWSNVKTILPNLVNAKVTTISHNHLLVSAASKSSSSVGFRNADWLLKQKVEQHGGRVSDCSREVAKLIIEKFLNSSDLLNDSPAPFKNLLMDFVYQITIKAEHDLSALEQAKLPEQIWTGTFNKWSCRAIGLSVLMRGGSVQSFDHGGGVGNLYCPETFQNEISCGASFVACSPLAAALIRKTLLGGKVSPERIMEGSGDPSFHKIIKGPILKGDLKKKVIYSTTVFRGDRQYSNPHLPDPVYFVWQRQVVSTLNKININAILKPHPEGHFAGRHPLDKYIKTSFSELEDELTDNCVLVFDHPHSTLFWKGLCSNAPVIFLNLGTHKIHTALMQKIKKRARVLSANFDEFGIPQLDEEQFIDTLMSAKAEDPSFFRELICAKKDAHS